MSMQEYEMIPTVIQHVYLVATRDELIDEHVEMFGDVDTASEAWDNSKHRHTLDKDLMTDYKNALHVFLALRRRVRIALEQENN